MFNVVCLLGWCETFQYGSIEKRVADRGPTLSQHWFKTEWLLGYHDVD